MDEVGRKKVETEESEGGGSGVGVQNEKFLNKKEELGIQSHAYYFLFSITITETRIIL